MNRTAVGCEGRELQGIGRGLSGGGWGIVCGFANDINTLRREKHGFYLTALANGSDGFTIPFDVQAACISHFQPGCLQALEGFAFTGGEDTLEYGLAAACDRDPGGFGCGDAQYYVTQAVGVGVGSHINAFRIRVAGGDVLESRAVDGGARRRETIGRFGPPRIEAGTGEKYQGQSGN